MTELVKTITETQEMLYKMQGKVTSIGKRGKYSQADRMRVMSKHLQACKEANQTSDFVSYADGLGLYIHIDPAKK